MELGTHAQGMAVNHGPRSLPIIQRSADTHLAKEHPRSSENALSAFSRIASTPIVETHDGAVGVITHHRRSSGPPRPLLWDRAAIGLWGYGHRASLHASYDRRTSRRTQCISQRQESGNRDAGVRPGARADTGDLRLITRARVHAVLDLRQTESGYEVEAEMKTGKNAPRCICKPQFPPRNVQPPSKTSPKKSPSSPNRDISSTPPKRTPP